MPGAHQNYQSLGAGGLYGGNVIGQGTSMPNALSELDAVRMAMGRVPQAEYPDGYLGTFRSRRDDRLLDSVVSRVNQKAYQRGVHKGERIDMQDYYWPMELQPDRGLRNEARGLKTSFDADLLPAPHLVNDGKSDITAHEPATRVEARRQAQLGRLMPTYK